MFEIAVRVRMDVRGNDLEPNDFSEENQNKWEEYGTDNTIALEAQAEAGRMLLLNFRASTFYNETTKGSLVWKPQRRQWVMAARKHATRGVVGLVFESAMQANLQGTVYAINVAVQQGENAFDLLTIVSLVLGMIVALYNLITTGTKLYNMTMLFNHGVDEHEAFCEQHVPEHYEIDRNEIDEEDVLELKQSLFRTNVSFVVSAVLVVLLLCYATAKIVAALFACSDGVWNVSGCVVVNLTNSSLVSH